MLLTSTHLHQACGNCTWCVASHLVKTTHTLCFKHVTNTRGRSKKQLHLFKLIYNWKPCTVLGCTMKTLPFLLRQSAWAVLRTFACVQVQRLPVVTDRACEFPSVAPSVVGKAHKHAYFSGSRVTGDTKWGPAQVCATSFMLEIFSD